MTYVTCRLTAKNRDQLRDPMLGNRVRATFTFLRNLASPTERPKIVDESKTPAQGD